MEQAADIYAAALDQHYLQARQLRGSGTGSLSHNTTNKHSPDVCSLPGEAAELLQAFLETLLMFGGPFGGTHRSSPDGRSKKQMNLHLAGAEQKKSGNV